MNAMLSGIRRRYSDIDNINTTTLHNWYTSHETTSATPTDSPRLLSECGKPTLVIDARTKNEFDVSRLKGAKNIDYVSKENILSDFLTNHILTDSKPVQSAQEQLNLVCYCSIGYRSSILARRIQQKLDKRDLASSVKVYSMEGGLFKWAEEGLPMVDKDGRKTVLVHTLTKSFGKLLKAELRTMG